MKTAKCNEPSMRPVNSAFFDKVFRLVLRAAQVRAHTAVARGLIQAADREDTVQQALLAVWCAMAKFDPRRASLATFVELVVATSIASAARASHRHRVLCSLDFAADHSADPSLSRHELRIDVQRVLAACSDTERSLALLLMTHSRSEASRVLHVARSTVYQRIQQLRLRFSAAGLGPRREQTSPNPAGTTRHNGTAL
jgi:RNA polymerase sigma factor (sigma-70 family)